MKIRVMKRRRDGVSQHYRVGFINKRQRKVFNEMSSKEHPIEFGGVIHFQGRDKNLKEFTVISGKNKEVDLPDGSKVKYHTHPSDGFDPPSPTDIMALLADDEQEVELVFNDGMAISVIKTPDLKDFLKQSNKAQEEQVRKAFYDSYTPVEYKKNLEKLGFFVQINKKLNEPIVLEAKI